MRNVSAAYLEAIRARTRTDKLTGTITLTGGTEVPLTEKNIITGSVSITKECVSGEELEFGSVIYAQLGLGLITDQSRYAFYNAKVNLVYHILLADETWYSLDLGEFKVAEAEKRGTNLQLVAYDNLSRLSKSYDGTQLYGTPYELLVLICEACGLEFGMTEEEVEAFPNGDQALQLDATTGCATYRDCTQVVAQMLASFATLDEAGRVRLQRYKNTPVATLSKAHRFPPTIADFVCQYAGVVITSNKGRFASYNTEVETGLELNMDAPAWDYGTEETLQLRADALAAELKDLAYTPCSFEMPGDPSLECGDMLELAHTADEDNVRTLITSIIWRYRGRTAVDSAGKNPYLHSVKPKQSQIIRELHTQTTNNKLIFYSFSNAAEKVISGTEVVPLANVTFVTVEDTSAMFLAQLPLTVQVDDIVTTTEDEKVVEVTDATGAATTILDAEGNPLTLKLLTRNVDTKPGTVDVEVYYYLDGSLVDYTLVERLTAGPHILSLFYPFSGLKGGQNFKWDVRLKVAQGSVTIAKSALKATITGQGLSATTVWDGTLSFEEVVPAISLQSKLTLADITEEVSTQTQTPTLADFVQTVAAISLRSRLTLGTISERVSTTEIRQKKTIDTAEWDYTDRYVEIVGSEIMARVAWRYESEEQTIDQGRMTAVKAVTNDLVSVTGMEVDAE